MLRSMRGHLTDACEHDQKEWCTHCEEGCTSCGSLDLGNNDDGLCPECEFNFALEKAESYYEGDR